MDIGYSMNWMPVRSDTKHIQIDILFVLSHLYAFVVVQWREAFQNGYCI